MGLKYKQIALDSGFLVQGQAVVWAEAWKAECRALARKQAC